MRTRYEEPKIEIYKILECPITESVGTQEQENDNIIGDTWD